MAVADGREVKDRVLDCDSSKGGTNLVGDGSVLDPPREVDCELRGMEDMGRGGPLWQVLSWSSSPDDGTLARLGDAVVPCIEDSESNLVAHLEKRAEGQTESEALVVADKVAHVLQQEVPWAVELAVGEVGHDHRVLDQGPVALVETVHARVALARRAAHDELNVTRGGQLVALSWVKAGSCLHRVVTRVAVVSLSREEKGKRLESVINVETNYYSDLACLLHCSS